MGLNPSHKKGPAFSPELPLHGGDLERASETFGIPVEQWVDLSTGISPWSWPVPELPDWVWRRLPPREDGLEAAAQRYYGSRSPLVAVPGSQWAIAQLCPALLRLQVVVPGQRVAVPLRGYQEHRFAWTRAGFECVEYKDVAELLSLVGNAKVEHAVLIDPNNPTAERCPPSELRALAQDLDRRQGWLVVDQAFADLHGGGVHDLGSRCVVLRSLGKFFGLAGLRVGFVAAVDELLTELRARLGPWGIAHPARWIAVQALQDESWQQRQREKIERASEAWSAWLSQRLGCPIANAGLFCTLRQPGPVCERIYQALGAQGVLVRVFDAKHGQNLLRFGLPHSQDPAQWRAWFDRVEKGPIQAQHD